MILVWSIQEFCTIMFKINTHAYEKSFIPLVGIQTMIFGPISQPLHDIRLDGYVVSNAYWLCEAHNGHAESLQ